ncbi:hypothetical protein [Novosphingobium taihuense]|uniref:Uncharacterized protein n=1 Tax=Novosphingobium taihuense TaxID=260085 RepID=A0A7W7A8Q7_9SPHN|nr:hypothetical protein [Novosphingobium taihuense]MBB4611954.1 hypothetical protein [Novosphingobium taihuense]TWH88693.1 hypothetical protein IQ25_00816 [Novosphingobium taihuense]
MNAKSIFAAITGLSLVAMPVCASAHGSMKPSHGGIVTMSGETMVELVRGSKGVDVYVSEEDEPIAASGLNAKLTVTAAGEKKDAPLVAQSGNKLSAAGLKVPTGAKVVVALIDKRDGAKTFATFLVK